ncbi:hypothetical protein B0H34DRAFT_690308 [Crassisporium funariophilum]|nr:hypothetical protein B0H34DRAFT_690308 [Crassisporium funariophilum]
MEHDASDILGHSTMPVSRRNPQGEASFSLGKSVFLGFSLLVAYVVGKRLWTSVLLWRERSYKLATRRRHGIPDSDLRPFNVAYSEAMNRVREEESKQQLKSKPSFRPQGPSLDQRDTQPDPNLRYRPGVQQNTEPVLRPSAVAVPGQYGGAPQSKSAQHVTSSTSNNGQNFMDHYNPRQPIPQSNQFIHKPATKAPLTRQNGYRNIEDYSDQEGKKRSLDEQEDDEHELKKSRVEGDELIDGDEDAEFHDRGEVAPKRGSKRGLREEDDGEEVTESKKSRGKRARKVSQEKAPRSYPADEIMDIDDEEADEITELKSLNRGKKRDRAEAGSTFGGDDDDSAAELEADDAKARRRRKRRTVAKRKSEASYARSKKRDRDGDDEGDSDVESEEGSPVTTRKKRGKRGSHVDRHENDNAAKSDVSMDESTISARNKVRSIGDEWESNGVKYKIGPNGQRLRQALVKKARQKFVMPKDSQHPDRNANLQVCIESWLTEEEYQEAKEQHMLAWQDSPRRSEEPGNLSIDIDVSESGVEFPRGAAGKNLLWGSSTASTPTASPASHSPATDTPPETARPQSYRKSYRHSIATTVGLPISPFANSQLPTVKRIASTSRMSLGSSVNGAQGLSDSTNGSPRIANKVFSKWEKQELEARAMMKMREVNKKKEMEREAKLKEEKERVERAALERASAERERQERERAERERMEREKAEADRKAKEATAAAATSAAQLPKITVTAPTLENVASQSGAPAAPNFFSKPSESTSPFGAPKPAAPGVASSSSFFSNSTQPSQTTATSPSGTAGNQTDAAKPTSAFPSSGSSSAPKPGVFSFSASTPATSNSGAQAFSSPAGRIGGTQHAPLPEPQKPAAAQSSFSFPPPQGLGQMNGNNSQNGSSQAAPAPATSTTTTPKFNFGFTNKTNGATTSAPAAASTSAFPASSSSSLNGALGSDPTKAAANNSTSPNFAFKTPATPATAPSSGNNTTPATAGGSAASFSFGSSAFNTSASTSKSPFNPGGNTNNTSSAFSSNAGSSPSPFGGSTTPGQSVFGGGGTFGANKPADAPKSVFGGGSGGSVFGTKPGEAPKSVFGGGSGGSVFGTKPGEAPKSAFAGYGNAAPVSNPSTGDNTTSANGMGAPTKPMFSFATPAPSTSSTPASAGGSTFSFNFAGKPASTTPQASPFGAPAASNPSPFGNAAASNTTAPSPFGVFGAPSAQK